MKKSINDKIKALQSGAANQEEFMKNLAELDEKGQLTEDLLNQVNGGATSGKTSPLIDLPTLGLWVPTLPGTEEF